MKFVRSHEDAEPVAIAIDKQQYVHWSDVDSALDPLSSNAVLEKVNNDNIIHVKL